MKTWLRACLFCGSLLAGGLIAAPHAAAEPENAATLPDTPIRITERHTPVAVESEGDDSIGASLSTRVKELLNSSNLFMLEEKDTPKFRILISTAPEFPSRPGVGSAYSVVWLFSLSDATLRHYLDREIGLLTPDDVNRVAARIVEKTDRIAVRYGYLFPEQPQ